MVDSNSLAMRVKRGMVFWFDPFPYEKDKSSHSVNMWGKEISSSVQAGKRPWLVVSADEINGLGSVCNICPITTVERNGSLGMVHPSFEYRGKNQYVMVEQVTTVDLFALREYECFVSDEVMRNVEDAMKIQFGIRETYKNLELVETLKGIESVIEGLIRERLEALTVPPSVSEVEIENVALRLGELFEELLVDKSVEAVPAPIKSAPEVPDKQEHVTVAPVSPIDKFNRRYRKYKEHEKEEVGADSSSKSSSETDKRKRNKWNDALRRQFVQDCAQMSENEITEKYGLRGDSISQTRYACIRKLKEVDKEYH